MKKVEEQRTKTFQSEVKNTGIVINYRATLVPTEAGEEVASVYGTIVRIVKTWAVSASTNRPTVFISVMNRFLPLPQRRNKPFPPSPLLTWPKSS